MKPGSLVVTTFNYNEAVKMGIIFSGVVPTPEGIFTCSELYSDDHGGYVLQIEETSVSQARI